MSAETTSAPPPEQRRRGGLVDQLVDVGQADDQVDELDDVLTPLTAPMPASSGVGEGVEVVTARTVDGVSAAFVPVSMGRLTPDGVEAASDLQHHLLDLRSMQDHLTPLVGRARREGLSWDLIGWCLGVTGRAASKRYGNAFGGVSTLVSGS